MDRKLELALESVEYLEEEIYPKLNTAASIAGFGIGIVPWAIYRIIRSKYDKCTTQCGLTMFNTPSRQKCMLKCKEKMAEELGQEEKRIKLEKKRKEYEEYLKKKNKINNTKNIK